jgi:hypothetical protein
LPIKRVVLLDLETGSGGTCHAVGIYSIQRAFQAAGAKAALMRLWKVDDAATQQLIRKPGKPWLTGETCGMLSRKRNMNF